MYEFLNSSPLVPCQAGAIILAPMEGITDETYRLCVLKNFPGWDLYATDFLRLPSVGHYKLNFILQHFGPLSCAETPFKKRTIFQILPTAQTPLTPFLETIAPLQLPWLDLNFGCPSRTVNRHGGGAYLLSDLAALEKIVSHIRRQHLGILTAKIRIGYQDQSRFYDILSLLQDCGVNAITLHARTQSQGYKAPADWSYIAAAVKHCQIPIIGNGDVVLLSDINKLLQQTGCHGVMIGRGALRTPWMAQLYRQYHHCLPDIDADAEFLFEVRREYMQRFWQDLELAYRQNTAPAPSILKKFKEFSNYIFEEWGPIGHQLRIQLLRCSTLEQFKEHLAQQLLQIKFSPF